MRFLLAFVALLAGTVAAARRGARRGEVRAVVDAIDDHTTSDAQGAVRSVQTAEVTLAQEDADQLWKPHQLERLARTYWRFLTRVTLGVIRVKYEADSRIVYVLHPAIRLLRFDVPVYTIDPQRGAVRWQIRDGLLVASRGHSGDGYLEIAIERRPSPSEGRAKLHIAVEVANFYPSISHRLSAPVYRATQSKIHVLVTHAFLRSLSRLDLAESRVGRFPAPAGG